MGLKFKVIHLLKIELNIEKFIFSVVLPINVIEPFSMNSKIICCCFFDKK